jgi:hypothetical protein
MSRIHYDKSSPFGSPFNAVISQLVSITAQINRIKTLADNVTATSGAAALEGSPEFNVAPGQGAEFYAALVNIQQGLNSIVVLPSLDPGN